MDFDQTTERFVSWGADNGIVLVSFAESGDGTRVTVLFNYFHHFSHSELRDESDPVIAASLTFDESPKGELTLRSLEHLQRSDLPYWADRYCGDTKTLKKSLDFLRFIGEGYKRSGPVTLGTLRSLGDRSERTQLVNRLTKQIRADAVVDMLQGEEPGPHVNLESPWVDEVAEAAGLSPDQVINTYEKRFRSW